MGDGINKDKVAWGDGQGPSPPTWVDILRARYGSPVLAIGTGQKWEWVWLHFVVTERWPRGRTLPCTASRGSACPLCKTYHREEYAYLSAYDVRCRRSCLVEAPSSSLQEVLWHQPMRGVQVWLHRTREGPHGTVAIRFDARVTGDTPLPEPLNVRERLLLLWDKPYLSFLSHVHLNHNSNGTSPPPL